MYATVLGPLCWTVDDVPITPSAAKQRTMLALLLVNANRLVTSDALICELWPDSPPASARTTLHSYIVQLRRLLAARRGRAAARDVLSTIPGGYAFAVEPDQLDLRLHELLAAEARDAFERGDVLMAARLSGRALELWSGPPLADVRCGPQLEVERVRLHESRLNTQEMHIDAEIALGRHHEVLGELAVLTARHPLHESFQTQYMLALYRSGRRADALEAFRRLRADSITELGLEPSVPAQRLHESILRADPLLDLTGEAARAPG